MTKYFSSIFLLTVILLTSANCKKSPNSSFDLSLIENKLWLHSYEEDSADILTYRSEDFNLPPSRGRKGFKIMKDSTFILYSIAAADGWDKHKGKFSIKNGNTIFIDFGNKATTPKTWELVTLTKEKIQVKEKNN